jgi:trigger factor
MPKNTKAQKEITSTLAKGEDGSIQITFTVPWANIESAKTHAVGELAEETEVPGFRKGKAPLEKVKAHVSDAAVIEKALGHLLPAALGEALKTYKLKPAIYPKFELVSAKEGEDWQIRALTCELPEVKLGDYKAKLAGEARAKGIWTPAKAESKDKGPTKEEKEQTVLRILLDEIKLDIPRLLISEEVDSRLAGLLERTERLGLSLEAYLSSIGKTPETIRQEYEIQARNTIALELILNNIAQEEGIKISDSQIDEVISSSSQSQEAKTRLNNPEQRRLISSFLARRAALDSLLNI